MNKDVIYIDIEDDITAIIGKIKESKEKIVALVPPKRIGVLQSAVNLRLLVRMAENSHKRLVLVTNNKALINLSAVARIPIAKSLQSKPEMPELEDIETGEDDVIEGDKLPVGDLMKTADEPMDIKIDTPKKESVSDIIDEIDVEEGALQPLVKDGEMVIIPEKKIKVPDFVKFRRILFLGILGLICLSGFLFWAIKYAPAADVIITAKTEAESVSMTVKLAAETNIETSTIKAISQELTKDLSVTFEATGQKNIGNRAVGIITVENCDDNRPFTLNAGTIFTSDSGLTYTSDSEALVPGLSGSASLCRFNHPSANSVDVAVTATAPGEDYNIGEADYNIEGINGDVYAFSDSMAGGTTVMSAVVTATDIEKATEALRALSTDSVKQQLIKQFVDGESVMAESYLVTYGEFISMPAIDQEVTDKAILKSTTIFKMSAIAKSDLETYLNGAFSKKISSSAEKVYDNGIGNAKLSGYLSNAEGVTVKITASGEIGPSLDKDLIIELIKGKKFGDAQSLILDMPGVSDVEINFSYFWIQTVPNEIEKIDVQFILDNAQDN